MPINLSHSSQEMKSDGHSIFTRMAMSKRLVRNSRSQNIPIISSISQSFDLIEPLERRLTHSSDTTVRLAFFKLDNSPNLEVILTKLGRHLELNEYYHYNKKNVHSIKWSCTDMSTPINMTQVLSICVYINGLSYL